MPALFIALLLGLAAGSVTASVVSKREHRGAPMALGAIPYKFERSSPAMGGGGGSFTPPKPAANLPSFFSGIVGQAQQVLGAAVSAGGVTYGGTPSIPSISSGGGPPSYYAPGGPSSFDPQAGLVAGLSGTELAPAPAPSGGGGGGSITAS